MSQQAMDSMWKQLVLIALLAVLVTVGYPLYRSAAADGRTDYCYVQMSSDGDLPLYRLYAHVPWRSDRKVATTTTLEAATAAAAAAGCELR
jgi:hypothetical protein